MHFNADIDGEYKFVRKDNQESVTLSYDPTPIKGNPKQQELMMKLMQGVATQLEAIEFGKLWQERVEKIFENIDKVITIK
jgi:formylmethanofuran dehydrogenase subunit E